MDEVDAGQAVASEAFWRLHEGLPQQGPGSNASTRRALGMLSVPREPTLLDLGCGPGRQTLCLAEATGGSVTAVDLLPTFLEEVGARAAVAGLADRVTTLRASMLELPLPDECVDLVWSEGAIYNVGFEAGLRAIHRLLRPGGGLAVSEATWLVDEPPTEARRFWQVHYPAMTTVRDNERMAKAAGYAVQGRFSLPADDWWQDYYGPMAERIPGLRQERADAAWQEAIDAEEEEMRIVREFGHTFGYVFYVMTKTSTSTSRR